MNQENPFHPSLDISTYLLPVTKQELFGSDNKCALEIGFGEGEFPALVVQQVVMVVAQQDEVGDVGRSVEWRGGGDDVMGLATRRLFVRQCRNDPAGGLGRGMAPFPPRAGECVGDWVFRRRAHRQAPGHR